jgi:hypothetical protein
VAVGPVCLHSFIAGPTEPFLGEIIGSIIDVYHFFFFSFLSAARKKSLVFGVSVLQFESLLSLLLGFTCNCTCMIGLHKSLVAQIF